MKKHRIIRDGNYLLLCGEDGKPIPKQTYLNIECSVGNRMEVTMRCFVDPPEIEDDVLKEREYRIVEGE